MNKKIKKMLLLVLVLTFSLIFTGCGEEELNDYITSDPKTRVWLRRFDEKEWHDPTLAYMFPQDRVKEN